MTYATPINGTWTQTDTRTDDSVYYSNIRERVTADAIAADFGPDYAVADRGKHVSPQFSVFKLPQIGDAVSYAFNGDYTPCGHITAISKSGRKITTTDGRTFWRVKQTAIWRNAGTWTLILGHVEKRNPSF